MKKIIVASKNPVKIAAAHRGFQKMFPNEIFEIDGVSVPSGVRAQPQSDAETFAGAHNRGESASQMISNADFWVGIEGGVDEAADEMHAFAWVVIKSSSGKFGKARTGTFFLPPPVAQLIKEGKELGEADDIVFGKSNSKQVNGAVGLLTGDVVDRAGYYADAVVFALIPFKNEELYNIPKQQLPIN